MKEMKKRSNLTRFIVVLLLIGASGLVGWRIFNRPRPAQAVSISAIRERNGMPVTTWNVVSAPWEFWLPLYGTVRTSGLSEVYAYQAEYVTSFAAEVGDVVKKGQLLASLDSRRAAERVQAANARYREISMRYERTKELEKAGGSSKQEVESAYSQYRDAGALLQQLQTELSRHKVVSPIDGVVMQRNAELGLLASAGRPLFVIGDPKLFEIVIELSPRYVFMVNAGEKASFLNGGAWEEALVKRVDPMADSVTGLYKVVLDVQSTRLHIGASVEARIRIEHADNAVMVPYESVRETSDTAKVYVCSGDVAVERVVMKGRTNDQGRTRILGGLENGEVIVLKGADRMYDGARIWPQEI
ncbi:MAG: efflux RND transporter periplasmic adaptor subunit [Synergistaceae bacterium]|nr:efflux RND transporter periplasmic adaptor subunit [Synergistaceae bacterium]